MQQKDLISIGKISKPIGLKGYLKVISLTDFPERFVKKKKFKIYNEKEKTTLLDKYSDSEYFTMKDVIFDRDYIKILFENYEEINLVGKLVGCLIVLEEAERMQLEKGKYYLYDLIDADIIHHNEKIGKLISIENYGGQDLFKIKLDKEKKEVLIPFVDNFIKSVDIAKKIIEIEVIDGMLN